MSKPIGAAGLALIKQFEGCRLTAYKPVATEQYWTIGWGHRTSGRGRPSLRPRPTRC